MTSITSLSAKSASYEMRKAFYVSTVRKAMINKFWRLVASMDPDLKGIILLRSRDFEVMT